MLSEEGARAVQLDHSNHFSLEDRSEPQLPHCITIRLFIKSVCMCFKTSSAGDESTHYLL